MPILNLDKDERIEHFNDTHALDILDVIFVCEHVAESSEHTELACWQYLHDTGEAYKLQGYFGRACAELIAQGVIEQ